MDGTFSFNCDDDPFFGGLNSHFSGYFAVIDDDAAGGGESSIKSITSPTIDLSSYSSTKTLSFAWTFTYFYSNGDDFMSVQAWNGSSWDDLFTTCCSDDNGFETIDVSSYSNTDFKLRFVLDDAGGWVYGFGVDSVKITAEEEGGGGSDACFAEDFSDIVNGNSTQTTGSSSPWAGNTNFPTVERAYQAGGAVKLGTGSLIGSIESRDLTEVSGDITVNIMVKGWTNIEGDLKVSIDGQDQTLSYTAKMADPFEQVTATFTGVTAGSNLKIETTAKRAFIDNVEIVCEGGGSGDGPCANVTIGEGGTATSSWIPIYYLYDYSYSQAIYTAAELQAEGAGAGYINKISYLPNGSVSTEKWRNWTIYMANTTKSEFTGTTEWIPVSGNMQEVFSGDIADDTVAGEWLSIDLDSSFAWDGTSNIVIAVIDNTPGWGGSPFWKGYASGSTRGIYVYRDTTPYDVDNPGTATGTTANLPQIQFCGDLLPNCADVDAGVIDGPEISCPLTSFTLEAVGASNGETGLVTQWQSSPDGAAWSDIAGETNTTLITTITAPTYFRYTVECTFSDDTDTSDSHFVDLNTDPSECYCTPGGTNSTYLINDFSTTGGTTSNITNLGTGYSPDGYGNFYDSHSVTQDIGGAVDFEAVFAPSGYTYGFRIWVDWNQDGVFDPVTEVAWNSTGYAGT